jgi:hypothetical protein
VCERVVEGGIESVADVLVKVMQGNVHPVSIRWNRVRRDVIWEGWCGASLKGLLVESRITGQRPLLLQNLMRSWYALDSVCSGTLGAV